MKKKELKNLAAKIAKYETIIQTSDDKKAVHQAEEEIIEKFDDFSIYNKKTIRRY